MVATLAATVVAVTILGFLGVLFQWNQANTQREISEARRADAEEARAEAERARRDAELARDAERQHREKVESSLYFQDIALAQREWLAGNPRRARQLLNACAEPRRGWEWHYLDAQMHSDVASFAPRDQLVYVMRFSPDGTRIATCGGVNNLSSVPGEIVLRDTRSGDVLHVWRPSTASVSSIDFSHDGMLLASSGKNMRIHDAQTLDVLHRLPNANGWHHGIVFHPRATMVAAGGGDGVVRVWDVATQTVVHEFAGHTRVVWDVAFNEDGSLLASTSHDGTTRLWDMDSGVQVYRSDTLSSGRTVTFSPDGRFLAESGYVQRGGLVQVWDLRPDGISVIPARGETRPIGEDDRHRAQPRKLGTRWFSAHGPNVEFTQDSQCLIVPCPDGRVRIWNPETDEDVAVYQAHTHALSADDSPDGRMLATVGDDSEIRIWDRAAEADVGITANFAHLHDLAFDPNDQYLAIPVGRNRNRNPPPGKPAVLLWNVKEDRKAGELLGHTSWVHAVSWAQDGQWLASGGEDQQVRVWNVSTNECIHVLPHGGAVTAVVFAPNGDWVVSVGTHETAKLWDVSNLSQTTNNDSNPRELVGHSGPVNDVAVDHRQQLIATVSDDHTLRLWNPESAELIETIQYHDGPVKAVAFSADGQWLASSDEEGRICLFRRVSGEQFELAYDLRGHAHPVNSLAFTPDGSRLASSDQQHIKLWDTSSGQDALMLKYRTYGKPLAFSHDGRRLAFCTKGYSVTLLDTLSQPLDLAAVESEESDRRFVRWHEQNALYFARINRPAGAEFHLNRLVELTPEGDDGAVQRRLLAQRRRSLGRAFYRQGQTARAIDQLQLGLDVHSENAWMLNYLAWIFATCPEAHLRNPERAVKLARKAIAVHDTPDSKDGQYRNTLGVALYRCREFTSAIDELKASMALRAGGDAFDWFFLAMAHHQLGRHEQARHWYSRAVESSQTQSSEELRRFQAEAEDLLGPVPAASDNEAG